jgi:uncharacterized protein (DUF1330 family)
MPAYLIARVHITNLDKYKEYMKLTPAAIAAHGGRFVVRGGAVETLEGPHEHDRVVVIEFPSVERAKTFWNSPEYGEAKAKRAGAATGQFLLLEGAQA